MTEPVFARVAVDGLNYAADKPFEYLLPDALAPCARVGQRVLVPFGRGNRLREGLILTLEQGAPKHASPKAVRALLDEEPYLDERSVKMALWLRENCFCTLYEAARAMLPAGYQLALREEYRIVKTPDEALTSSQQAVCDLLAAKGGRADVKTIGAAFGGKNFRPHLSALVSMGVIEETTTARMKGGDKTENMVEISVPAEELMEFAARKRKSAPVQARVAELLAAIGSGWQREICDFAQCTAAAIKALEKAGLVAVSRQEVLRRPDFTPGRDSRPKLTANQQEVLEGLEKLLNSPKPEAALLFGVTGSGKTQVYLSLVEKALEQGRGAIVLVPEIALTPQLMSVFAARFGDRAALMHSALGSGERFDEYKRIRSGAARVVLGTRSAIFAPVRNLGLIIIDEEQERTYKSESNPRYHARQAAKYRCGAEGAMLLLGSATPDIESAYHAAKGRYHSFSLKQRYNDAPLPAVEIVDMKKELRSGNGGLISGVLKAELQRSIAAGRQSILFINRRGSSRLRSCAECGYIHYCPNCSVPMTWHSQGARLMCHYCGHSEGYMELCPECGGLMRYVGAGTQKVQEELEKIFPGVEILRMDADTVTAVGSHDRILAKFRSEKIPILLGTQMVTKGLDFENVTLVGVLAADMGLYVDDFRAGERTFSLITQVVGRAGRGSSPGRAVIQTFTPENEVIQLASKQDYHGFYADEIRRRRLQNCPPFADMMAVTASGMDEAETLRICVAFRDRLREVISREYPEMPMKMLGPAPYQIVKMNNRYRWKLTLLCRNDRQTRSLLGSILKEFAGGRVNVYIDVDP